jgi:membrane protease YdiL (CAAX protease family)
MKNKLKNEFFDLVEIIRSLDKKVVLVFLSVAVLQTISWYYASRSFFRRNFYYTIFEGDHLVGLYEYLYWFLSEAVPFLLLPILIIKFVFKDKISDYGLTPGDFKVGMKITAIFFMVMLPIVWVISTQDQFSMKYPHLTAAKSSWYIFLIYECGMLIYMFAWEFIWRGFMMFGLKEKFGYYAVLIQMIPFLILHNGKPELETFGAILGGIALGILAYRTRSVLYCVLLHFGVMFSIDLISSLRFRAGDYGIGFDSIVAVVKHLFI